MTTRKAIENQAPVNTEAVNPLIKAIDTYLESSGTEADTQQLHSSMEEIKRRNAEAKIPIFNCTLEYECPKTWAELTPTAAPNGRHCHACSKDVIYCTSQTQLDKLSVQGACVAFQALQGRQLVGSLKPSGRKVSKDELRAFIDNL
jgi:hypothetical protein